MYHLLAVAKPKILFVFPTDWDVKQLAASRADWAERFEVILDEPTDHDCPWDFDVMKYIDRTIETHRGQIDGVTSSSDYPGATVAAAVATALSLPGPSPEAVIRTSHKYYSRLRQREVTPEATPPFWLVDPTRPEASAADVRYPSFIKPVKGAFSVMSRRLDSPADLFAFLDRPATREFTTEYVRIFNQIVAECTTFDVNGSHFLAEGFLRGSQVTVEGYDREGRVEIVGIVDSVNHPGTGSFARFDYPSVAHLEVQDRMADIARRIITRLELRNAMFNIEMMHEPASDTISIVEVNPRMCGQFSDLYRKVSGVGGHEIAISVAAGLPVPAPRGTGAHRWATSFPLRTFRPVRVDAAPDGARVHNVERRHGDALIWWECSTGDRLVDFERLEDGFSYRYGVINVGADTRAGLLSERDRIVEALGVRLSPL